MDDGEYLQLAQLRVACVDQMRRIYTPSKRIAKGIMPPTQAVQRLQARWMTEGEPFFARKTAVPALCLEHDSA